MQILLALFPLIQCYVNFTAGVLKVPTDTCFRSRVYETDLLSSHSRLFRRRSSVSSVTRFLLPPGSELSLSLPEFSSSDWNKKTQDD